MVSLHSLVSSASPKKPTSVLIGCRRLMLSAQVLAHATSKCTMVKKYSFGDEARYFQAYRCPPMRSREGIRGKSMEAFVDRGRATSRQEPAVPQTSKCLRPRA